MFEVFVIGKLSVQLARVWQLGFAFFAVVGASVVVGPFVVYVPVSLQTGLSSYLPFPLECLLKSQFPSEPALQPLGHSGQDPTHLSVELFFNSRAACLHSASVLTSVPWEQ
jgi:hypothetical protein